MENIDMDLYEKLSRLQWLLHRHHLHNHAEYGPLADPTRGQGRVLAILKMQPEITTKHLAYLLGIRQQSLNELLNKLEKSGYVSRKPAESDKRVMVVSLTEKGKNEHYMYTDFGDMFSCLNQEEQAAFGEYLDRVIAALEAQLGVEDGDEAFEWLRAAREHMGEEMFEHLRMCTRGGRRPFAGRYGEFPRGDYPRGREE